MLLICDLINNDVVYQSEPGTDIHGVIEIIAYLIDQGQPHRNPDSNWRVAQETLLYAVNRHLDNAKFKMRLPEGLHSELCSRAITNYNTRRRLKNDPKDSSNAQKDRDWYKALNDLAEEIYWRLKP